MGCLSNWTRLDASPNMWCDNPSSVLTKINQLKLCCRLTDRLIAAPGADSPRRCDVFFCRQWIPRGAVMASLPEKTTEVADRLDIFGAPADDWCRCTQRSGARSLSPSPPALWSSGPLAAAARKRAVRMQLLVAGRQRNNSPPKERKIWEKRQCAYLVSLWRPSWPPHFLHKVREPTLRPRKSCAFRRASPRPA